MHWINYVRLVYRYKRRQAEDPELKVNELFTRLSETTLELDFGEPVDYYWLLDPSVITTCLEQGYLMVEREEKPHIVIREIEAKLYFEDFDNWKDVLDELKGEIELEDFAIVEIIRQNVSEVLAV